LATKFEIFTGNDGQFYWRFKGANGETVCHSEGYTTKQSAQVGINSVKNGAVSAEIVDLTQSTTNVLAGRGIFGSLR
jgi:hypothetical protein